jgi:hypothetical protein
MTVTKTRERTMLTIKTKQETITINDRIISDYRRLMTMPSTTEGLDGITIDSCFNNGYDIAKEQGFCPSDQEFEDVAIYYTVSTARTYEIL